MGEWTRTADEEPPDGAVVETLSSNGQQQQLKRQGRLWFFPDGSMYVYYTPEYWRPAQERGPDTGGGKGGE